MGKKTITTNRKAYFNYTIIEKYEAGISLLGSEVKSIRAGHIDIKESYVAVAKREAFLYNANISAYEHLSDTKYEPVRPRKLLLHKREITKLLEKTTIKGLAIIPTEVYLKNGLVKVEIAVAKGKKHWDKREAIKEKEVRRELRNIRG
ncbi:MAG: SsrA-binding protein SmpB [Elusimicrobia bacterium]|nr:SsrA-binding protein SmpB [Elusimicrobiota bacterium]